MRVSFYAFKLFSNSFTGNAYHAFVHTLNETLNIHVTVLQICRSVCHKLFLMYTVAGSHRPYAAIMFAPRNQKKNRYERTVEINIVETHKKCTSPIACHWVFPVYL